MLLMIGFYFGSKKEKAHYQKLKRRELQFSKIPAVNFKSLDNIEGEIISSKLVIGSTVVSVDYFKRFLATLKLFTGGRLTSYESLLERARREAILRMKESAPDSDMFLNLRIETSSIGKSTQNNNSVGSIEILAFATAINFKL